MPSTDTLIGSIRILESLFKHNAEIIPFLICESIIEHCSSLWYA